MSPALFPHTVTRWFAALTGLFAVAILVSIASRAQDPAVVSPDHYKVEIDNELVRVLRSSGPGRAHTSMHDHPANVVIYLTDADVRVIAPDGAAKDSHRKRGEAIWNGPQKHERVNLSDKPYELIQIELKKPRSDAAAIPAKMDPLAVTPGRYTIFFENDHVRVLRSRGGPRAKADLHSHPPYVSVAMTATLTRVTDVAGKYRDVPRKAGSVAFNPALTHKEENLTDQPFEYVLVELK